ncbi:DUF58 domain-containing protein [Candidatus Babeliales bacterium]|nr:DUF58 domain-containing protein [Candidatus Babeliales bacterium]
MIAVEIAQKVKELEIYTRRMLSGSLIGNSKTRQKGFGFEFDQLRTYQYGDDVRLIDWKSSARNFNNLLVRQYFEERNRTIMICVDVSASTMFGSNQYLKYEIMQQVAGILALAGQWSQDQVGLILFSDRIEKMLPPAKGQKHVHGILTDLFSYQAVGKGTDFDFLCEHVAQRVAKRAMILVISDFIGGDFSQSVKKIAHDKDVIAINVTDLQEKKMNNVGLVWMKDPETGSIELVNVAGSSQQQLSQALSLRLSKQNLAFQGCNVDNLYIQDEKTLMHDLLVFFQKRMM